MKEFEKDIEQCLKVLKEGGIILYPTDTIWGIGCDATNESAVKKIYQLKKRSESKAMIILLADQRDLLKYVATLDLGVFDCGLCNVFSSVFRTVCRFCRAAAWTSHPPP